MNGSNIANPMVTSDDLSKRNPVAADPDSTSHQSVVRSENKRLKETLVTSAADIASILNENEVIKEEVKKNDALLGSLKKQNTVLNQNLSIVRKDAEKLRSENLILENSVNVGKGEVETLKKNNLKLKDQLDENKEKKELLALDEQIFVLEKLIEEKKKRQGDSFEDISVLQNRLDVCSEKKRKALRKGPDNFNLDRLEKASRNLLDSFEHQSGISGSNFDVNENIPISVDADNSIELNEKSTEVNSNKEIVRSAKVNLETTACVTVTVTTVSSTNSNPLAITRSLGSYVSARAARTKDPSLTAKPINQPLTISSTSLHQPLFALPSSRHTESPPTPKSPPLTITSTANLHPPTISTPGRSRLSTIASQPTPASPPTQSSALNDTLVQSAASDTEHFVEQVDDNNEDVDRSITFEYPPPRPTDTDVDVFDKVLEDHELDDKSARNFGLAFKVNSLYWEDSEIVEGPVPYGHNGKAVFKIKLQEKKKLTEIQEISDGYHWSKKKVAKIKFHGCTDRKRYYQDCNGFFECPNQDCSARKLFSKPSQNYVKNVDTILDKKEVRCSSCNHEMVYVQCQDETIRDKYKQNPRSRRYLDFDFCHEVLWVKYVGTHSCKVQTKVPPMDVEFVKSYFKQNPGCTAATFKDYAINKAYNEDQDVEMIAMQYADLDKIRHIMVKQKKTIDPDGTGIGYLKGFSLSVADKLKDKYLLTVVDEPKMVIISSEERMKVAALLSDHSVETNESASIDFCESQFKNYSVMEVTTYSGELRQLVPMFQVVFEKPAENAENVCSALMKIDEMLIEHSNTSFDPMNWTSDNSGAIENGIIKAKGAQSKPFLASDKLHDHNNIQRVIRTVPAPLQSKIKTEIFKMINGVVPSISENIYACLLHKAKGFKDHKLLRSLLFNHRKRHKYWNCYRNVQDNNATSEQVNRVMTRHGKGEGLISGVQRMVRASVSDKAKFKLAAGGRMVNKGPTVKDRQVRVERGMLKNLPEVISSIEEEVNSQESPNDDNNLKDKALDDFAPRASDTHRSDKKRRTKKSIVAVSKSFKRSEYLKVKKQNDNLSVLHFDSNEHEVLVTFKRLEVGIENTVTVTQDCVTCTCTEHDANYYCREIVKVFELLRVENLTQKLSFSSEEFSCIVMNSKTLTVTTPKRTEWSILRATRKSLCLACKQPIFGGSLVGKCLIGKKCKQYKFHPSRICLPRKLSNIKAQIDIELSEAEIDLLLKNGIVFR